MRRIRGFLTDLFKAGLFWLVCALCQLQRDEAWVGCFVRSVLMFFAVAGAWSVVGFLEVFSDLSGRFRFLEVGSDFCDFTYGR